MSINKKQKKKNNSIIKIIILFMLICTGFIMANIISISVFKTYPRTGTDLNKYITNVSTKTKTIRANRGKIYDANGIVLAQDAETYTLIAVLSKDRPSNGKIAYVDDPGYTARMLAPILGMEEGDILKYLTKNVYQTELGTKGRKLSKETKEEIEALNLNGIEFEKTITRSYPLSVFASNLIGYAQADEQGSVVGMMGVEQVYNEELTGINGKSVSQTDKFGYVLPNMTAETTAQIDGQDIYLTIDYDVQTALETAMKMTSEQVNASKIWGSVMEVDTGRVLAWGQTPSFDANDLNITDYYNYGIQMAYEPGSTMKSITYATAIDLGIYNGTELVSSGKYCYGSDKYRNPYRLGVADGKKVGCITNAGYKDWGMIEYDKGLVYSSNVVTATLLSEYIGTANFNEYLHAFGFFEPLETDGFTTAAGIQNYTWAADKVSLSYGQGSTVTTLHLLQAYSALLTDGTMKKPHFVDKIIDPNTGEVVYQSETTITGQPIKASTAEQVQSLLYRVVNDDDGTAKHYKIDGVEIMGKTGTTEVAGTGGTGYNTNQTIVSVALALPADDPKYVITYAYQAEYDRLAHVKSEPVKYLLSTIATKKSLIKSDSEGEITEIETENKTKIESLETLSVLEAQEKILEIGGVPIVVGNGSIVLRQSVAYGEEVYKEQKIFLETDGDTVTIPDFTGWSRKEVELFSAYSGANISYIGSGIVRLQSIEKGTTFSKSDYVVIEVQLK